MRQFEMKKTKEVVRIYCNQCGKEIHVSNGTPQEDVLSVEKRWGYFSGKDNEVHRWELCEDCYDKWIQSFVIPVEKE
ncbi:MAG: hypothetical protein RR869_05885 [Lachnospiraceae bacterium]